VRLISLRKLELGTVRKSGLGNKRSAQSRSQKPLLGGKGAFPRRDPLRIAEGECRKSGVIFVSPRAQEGNSFQQKTQKKPLHHNPGEGNHDGFGVNSVEKRAKKMWHMSYKLETCSRISNLSMKKGKKRGLQGRGRSRLHDYPGKG